MRLKEVHDIAEIELKLALNTKVLHFFNQSELKEIKWK